MNVFWLPSFALALALGLALAGLGVRVRWALGITLVLILCGETAVAAVQAAGPQELTSALRWAIGNAVACTVPAAIGYGLMRLVRAAPARA
ncbi:MAG: hypothetical protein QOK40_3461 [Miltoncostaeaceae bacterium]|nr:hypothetical protein [Miltoncostaeaceae bacterium]